MFIPIMTYLLPYIYYHNVFKYSKTALKILLHSKISVSWVGGVGVRKVWRIIIMTSYYILYIFQVAALLSSAPWRLPYKLMYNLWRYSIFHLRRVGGGGGHPGWQHSNLKFGPHPYNDYQANGLKYYFSWTCMYTVWYAHIATLILQICQQLSM